MRDHRQILINTLWSLAADEQGGNEIWSALKAMDVEVPSFVDDYGLLSSFIMCELGAQYSDGEPIANEEYLQEWEELKAEYAYD